MAGIPLQPYIQTLTVGGGVALFLRQVGPEDGVVQGVQVGRDRVESFVVVPDLGKTRGTLC